jgi:uncharacterized sulfatase
MRSALLRACASLFFAALLLPGTALAQASQVAETALSEKPNILWIDVEDLSPDLSSYGNELVHTPNIDRLAEEGVRYTHAFAVNPICSPSRSGIITGMYPTTIGAHNHRSSVELPEQVELVTQLLRETDYFITARRPKNDYNFSRTPTFRDLDWDTLPHHQPFFAQIHFQEAHRTFQNDPDHPIDPAEVDLPPYYPNRLLTRVDWARYLETIQILDERVGWLLERLEEAGLAENTVVFLTSDHGRAMPRGKEWLYEGGIRVPLIVRWPGRIEPGQVREKLISNIDLAPTWLEIAGVAPPEWMQGRPFLGYRTNSREYVVATRDRAGSTVDRIRAMRTGRYKYMRNFYPKRPYLQFNEYKYRQYPTVALIEQLQRKDSLSEKVARFAAPRKPKEELYDLKRDPHELNNLADDPAHQELLKRMRSRLNEWIIQTGDKGRLPESPAAVNARVRHDITQFSRAMRERGLSAEVSLEKYLDWWRQELGVDTMNVK